MLVASIVISLVGVLVAGIGAWKAFHVNPRDYTNLVTIQGRAVEPAEIQSASIRDLVLDQRGAARWVLAGTVLQFISVLLALVDDLARGGSG